MILDRVYVRISESTAYNGEFATKEIPSWQVDLVNDDTNEKKICSGMNEWSVYFNKLNAEVVAEEWAKFLGTEVRRFKKVVKTVYEYVEEE